ncbi:hypothetical protein VIBNISOn1_1050026 [Vibrio nigripulchritudo SOn1]|uniref:Uncharacterized protein n=1 Tax=Vibrio nigripulchritudo SOn1 TaxID=1238450 RepID=A0AAV2VIE7_9VIBR|nr:hypothetical protein [Vibrio nigripulchritudo]CCO44200.1 hypothetical protein VIBNISOn1_1050026 [Vibrio nigripulchritudo SOn1]
MYKHTVIARYEGGVVASKMEFTTEIACGMETAANPEANRLACERLGVKAINLSYLHGSTVKVS